VRDRILSLPDATRLYPSHDYRGATVTTVEEEKRLNPRLGMARSEDEFAEIMQALKLAYPKRMDEAVPANLRSGLGPRAVAERRTSVAQLVSENAGRQDTDVAFGLGI
jgi:hypothetical protein